jgi:hypothetical protein
VLDLRARVGEKVRPENFVEDENRVSALLAIAAARRIKASHRRRWRVAVGQSVFRDYDPSTGRYVESDPIGLKGGVSTYGYVGASPLMWKDTYGLVRWEGSAMPASTGIGPFAAGAYVFNLTSQCVKGRKAHVLVRAWGLGLGVGIKYLPITSSADNVTLEDHLPDIAPSNFNGLFGTLGFSVGVGGCTGYQIGSEWTPAVTKNPASCSWGVNGVDLGGGIQIGKSTLVGLKWEKCSDCGPVDTPFK